MSAIRFVGLACSMCLGVMLGLLFGGSAPSVAVLLIGAGGALMLVSCAMAER